MRAFILVCENGSFTKAAEYMHITQSGLSALVRELEAQLGFRLLERTTRRLALTPAGGRFLSVAREVIQNLDEQTKDIRSTLKGKLRSLRVAASPIMVTGILPYVLQAHLQRYPDDTIELVDVSREDVLPEVERGVADLGLGIFFRPLSGIRLYRLFSSSLILISPPAWQPVPPSRGDRALRVEQLPVSRLIRLPQDNPFQLWVDDRLAASSGATLAVNRSMRFRNIESCIAMVEMGAGHFIAPDFVMPVCRRFQVAIRSIRLAHEGVEFYAIARAGMALNPVTRDFVDSFLITIIERQIGKKHAPSGVS